MTNQDSKYYTSAFKQKVIQEVLSGQRSATDARRHYGIGGKMTVKEWLLKHKASETHILEQDKKAATNHLMKEETKSNETLLAELEALKRLLDVERKRSESYLTMIKKAELEFNIPIEKKSGAKPSKK